MNPYHNRTAIRDEQFFIGRQRELADILALVTASQPQSVAIIGDRRIGKSSVLQAMLRRLRAQDDSLAVYQDVQSVTTEGEFFKVIVGGVAIASQSAAHGEASAYVLRQQVEQIASRQRLVILLDEFDAIARNKNFSLTFFSFLRSLPNSWPVSLVLASARKLRDICYSDEVAGSPFFNIFHEKRLGSFKREESVELIRRLSSESGLPLARQEAMILNLAGDWPFFLQVVSYLVYEECLKSSGAIPDASVVETSAYDELRGHIEYLWKHLTEAERNACIQAAVGAPLHGFSQGVVRSLVLRGILADDAGRFRPSCRMFHSFITTAAEHAAARQQATAAVPRPIRVFVSYSHDDATLIEKIGILKFLSSLENDGVAFWTDERISTGELWDDRIRAELKRTDIALLLVTNSFLNSPYCQRVEVREFLKARAASGLILFPVIVSPCEWERSSWLKVTQVVPKKGAITRNYMDRGKRDALYVEISTHLRAAADRLRESGSGRAEAAF